MSAMTTLAATAEEVALETLRRNHLKALDLVKAMNSQGFIESDVQRAISNLLSNGKIELTGDRYLEYKAA